MSLKCEECFCDNEPQANSQLCKNCEMDVGHSWFDIICYKCGVEFEAKTYQLGLWKCTHCGRQTDALKYFD
jgi:hypothetical protein